MMTDTSRTAIGSEGQLPDQHSLFGELDAMDVAKPSDLNQLGPASGIESASGNVGVLCLNNEEPESPVLGPLSTVPEQRLSDPLTTTVRGNADVIKESRILSALYADHARTRWSYGRAANGPARISRKENAPRAEIEIFCPTRRRIGGIEHSLLVGGFNGPFPQDDPAQPAVHQITLKNPIDQEVPGDLSVTIPALRSDFVDFESHLPTFTRDQRLHRD